MKRGGLYSEIGHCELLVFIPLGCKATVEPTGRFFPLLGVYGCDIIGEGCSLS